MSEVGVVSEQLKKIWITPFPNCESLVTLSFESAKPSPAYAQLDITSRESPKVPTEEHPLRHVITLGLLDNSALEMIRDVIDKYLNENT